jgi:hypothetical protein
MVLTKHRTIQVAGRLIGAAALVVAGSGTSTAQTIIAAQVLRVKQVYKPAAPDSGPWTLEVENTSQSAITAYGVSVVCHYPDGTTKNAGVTFDLGPLLAGQAGILAMADQIRSARPELDLNISRREDPSFGPGATRRDTYSPPKTSSGGVPDSIDAAPVTVIMDDGRAAGDPNDVAVILSGRNDELTKRTLLIDDLRLIEASANPAGALDDRLNVLATNPPSSRPPAKLLPGQTHVLADNPESRRAWRREQLLLLKRQVGSMDSSGLKAVILQFEAEAAVYARLSAYARQ